MELARPASGGGARPCTIPAMAQRRLMQTSRKLIASRGRILGKSDKNPLSVSYFLLEMTVCCLALAFSSSALRVSEAYVDFK